MPTLSEDNKAIFIQLKTDYDNLPWYSKLFYPSALAAQLNNMDSSTLSNQSAFNVYQAYVNHTWFFHTWFFSSLARLSNTPLNRALYQLHTAGLLTGDLAQANFNVVIEHQDPYGVASALKTLHTAGLLTGDSAQPNFNVVIEHRDPFDVAWALTILHTAGLLTGDAAQANRDALAGHQDPFSVADALKMLHTAGLLTEGSAQANRDVVAGHQNPARVADALCQLHIAGLLTGGSAQANRDAVTGHQDPSRVADALKMLHTAGLLTEGSAQANRDVVAGHQNPDGVACALKTLYTSGLLTGDSAQANFNAVAGSRNSYGVPNALCELRIADLLTGESAQANFNVVIEHQDPAGVAWALRILHTAGLLTEDAAQARFASLITYTDILLHETTRNLWERIPGHALTEQHWNRILQICRANLTTNPTVGRVYFTNYINQTLLGINPNQPQAFNTAQSTHTASVHQTVSESATRLKARYDEALVDLPGTLQEIETWVHAQERHDIEQRAIHQLVNASYEFTDPTSGITTKELIALTWTAIHDDDKRLGSVGDAENLFLQGLYDIQRAYNLTDNFEDRVGTDKKACASGTFNKLIEKLVGIHPDAELKYITHQGAVRKLMPLIREAATQHLHKNHENPTVKSLKEAIRPSVREQLFFEYGQAFEALTKHHDTFEAFKASDDYVPFQSALESEQDANLELMVDGKLLVPNNELDQELENLIASRPDKKEAPDEVDTKPATREALRKARLAFFQNNNTSPQGQPEELDISANPNAR